jgi:ATP-dependent 26S proteasome regulatory subunit
MKHVATLLTNKSLSFFCNFACIDIVKNTSGPRYVVGCRPTIDKEKLKQGARVALDMTTLTIMRVLPREVDPLVYNMSVEDPGDISFAGIGGLGEQIRELREVRRGYKVKEVYKALINPST